MRAQQRLLTIILFISVLLYTKEVEAIEWNGVRPIVEKMLSYYQAHTNFSMVIFDEWIYSDGSREAVGDTIFAHKYNDYGYIKNGHDIQVYTEDYDIYINDQEMTMNVKEVSEEELTQIAQLIPSQSNLLKYFEICDSSKLVSENSGTQTIDFYFNHPLMNKTRMVIDTAGKVKELYRYYTHPDQIVAQHTVFVLSKSLNTSKIEEFRQDNYIEVSKSKKKLEIHPIGEYKDYSFQFIQF